MLVRNNLLLSENFEETEELLRNVKTTPLHSRPPDTARLESDG